MKDVEALARDVRLLVLDVDGVLTDGGLYYDHAGNVTKRFHVQDGLGIKLAQAAGLDVAVITGLDHPAVERRVTELGIGEYHAGKLNKDELLREMCERRGIAPRQAAYVGDDWVDASVMRMVGLPVAVHNAQPEVKELAAYVTKLAGGHGAVREVIALILAAQGLKQELWASWSGGRPTGGA